uniref:ubiquitinyl hydrolase 1 n=1 Tax=Salmo trutta TaxID=8032 RepID=A0A673YHN0_SALTR
MGLVPGTNPLEGLYHVEVKLKVRGSRLLQCQFISALAALSFVRIIIKIRNRLAPGQGVLGKDTFQGDISHAVGLLTTQPPEEEHTTENVLKQKTKMCISYWIPSPFLSVFFYCCLLNITQVKLSIRPLSTVDEWHVLVCSRALEASVEDSAARVKRKRCEAQGESCSPADWIRKDEWPVGIRNVGNTCWFSAVIQSLFHLPVFRRLVLNYCLSERILEKCKSHSRNIAFMQELRCLFALMVGSTRRFVDPSAAVELLRDAFRSSEAQQDVSEFTHKLLDWLEDAFQLAANGNPEDKKENPMVQLFYGTFVAQRTHAGKTLSNIEQFGQYPLQVNGFNNLDECLEGAMIEGEIEALHLDQTISSGSERWFSKLPPVLTFELSRFEFNQSLGRPEKIHKKLEFPQIIYMDRYLDKNNEQIHNRREEVKRLKEQLVVLQQKLECYRNYGSGPTKYPLADMLQYVLEFACTKPTSVSPAEDVRLAASSPTPPGSNPKHTEGNPDDTRTPIYKPFTQCRAPMDTPPHPAPHSVTEEELRFVKTCLQRWRTEVEINMNGTLKASIDRVSQALEGMYSDNSLCQVPYRLHAVLVHEGQASAGHYWAYIYDHANQRWMKYNDVIVSESSWEELVRDSYGGMTNASAYCLMYIDDRLPHLIAEDTDDETGQVMQAMDSLPPILRQYVREDNRWFQQELKEWEDQFCQQPQEELVSPTAAVTSTRAPSKDDPAEPVPQPGAAQEPTGEQEHGIIMAIAKARQVFDKDGPEAGLIKAFQEEYSRLFELSQEETTPQQDPRLHHALVYFFQNQAPSRVIERTLLEGFTDRNLSFDDRSISIMREARAKLRLIKPEDMDMEEYMQWHDDYSQFRTVFVYLLTGLEQYQHGKVREALNYLNHAYKDNAMLLRRGEKRGMEQSLIAFYRRRCLKMNDNAATLFRSGEVSDVEEGMIIMNEAVIPCMHLMSRPDMVSQEDLDTMEAVRSHWCSYLGVDLDDSLQEKLGEFLPRVLDCSTEMVVLKDPPTVRSKVPHDLCSRLAAIMEARTPANGR